MRAGICEGKRIGVNGVTAAGERSCREEALNPALFGFAAGGSGILSSVAIKSSAPIIQTIQQIDFVGACTRGAISSSVSQSRQRMVAGN